VIVALIESVDDDVVAPALAGTASTTIAARAATIAVRRFTASSFEEGASRAEG
jgi:hypothetical protein